VKRVVSRTYAVVGVLAVLVGAATGGFVYAMAQDARQAVEARPSRLASSAKQSPQDQREEKGLNWVHRGDKAAATEMADVAILDYRMALEYLEDGGGCQSTIAKAVREKIANIQKKPYDAPCTAGSDHRLSKTN
jgi:hypothetical protein